MVARRLVWGNAAVPNIRALLDKVIATPTLNAPEVLYAGTIIVDQNSSGVALIAVHEKVGYMTYKYDFHMNLTSMYTFVK